jgi:hypothetical protein
MTDEEFFLDAEMKRKVFVQGHLLAENGLSNNRERERRRGSSG